MSRETSQLGRNQQYLFFFYHLLRLDFVKCSPMFLRIESAIPTFKDIRAAVARASWHARVTWIPDQWLDRESVHPDVGRSKNMLWSWWIKLFRIYVLEQQQIWYKRHSTQKDLSFLSMHTSSTWVDLLLAFNSSMISVRNIFVVHPSPVISSDFGIWPSLRLAVLETKAGPSVRDRQLLVRTRNFLHISLQINVWISQNSDQDRQLFQLSPEHWRLRNVKAARGSNLNRTMPHHKGFRCLCYL